MAEITTEKTYLEIENEARDKRYKNRQTKRRTIKNDLLKQLKDRQITESYYLDLVEDYMSAWDFKSELAHNIKTKGVSIIYQNGANQWGEKKNDSIPEFNRVNSQMLTILDKLGLKITKEEQEDNDDFKL